MGLKNPFYKVCIVGDSAVGKTTLLYQYLEKRFNPEVESTIGSNFFVKYLKMPRIKNYIILQIWDLAGQAHFEWVRRAFYKGAKGIVYVYDLSRRNTFDNLKIWKEEVEETIGKTPNILVGNKLDLINNDNRLVSEEESNKCKQMLEASKYYETSAKIGTGVKKLFFDLGSEMYKLFK